MDDDVFDAFVAQVEPALKARDLPTLARLLGAHEPEETVRLLEREDAADRAVLYRLLSRDRALAVFEMLDSAMRSELFTGLRDEHGCSRSSTRMTGRSSSTSCPRAWRRSSCAGSRPASASSRRRCSGTRGGASGAG